MRIAIVVRILATQGRPKLAIYEAQELTGLGHTVEIIFIRRSTRISGYEDLLRTVHYRVLYERNDSILVPLYDYITGLFLPDRKGDLRVDYNLLKKLSHNLGDPRPDLLICHDVWGGVAGYHAAQKCGIPYVVYVDEGVRKYSGILGWIANSLERRALARASSVFGITTKTCESLRQVYGIDARLDGQGFGDPDVRPFTAKRDELIAVSTWDRGREPHRYLEVLERIGGFRLNMVGNWRSKQLKEDFLSLVDSKNLRGRVALYFGVDEAKLSELYNQSKFAVRFGFGEYGAPSGITEAIRHGLPVITNRDMGISDIIEHSGVGLVLDKIDPSIIDSWLHATNNQSTYSRLQLRAISLTTENTWSSHAQMLVDL